MRAILCAAVMALTLGAARADLAPPPIAPAKGDDIAPGAAKDMTTLADVARDELKSIIESVKAPARDRTGRTVTRYPSLPPDPASRT